MQYADNRFPIFICFYLQLFPWRSSGRINQPQYTAHWIAGYLSDYSIAMKYLPQITLKVFIYMNWYFVQNAMFRIVLTCLKHNIQVELYLMYVWNVFYVQYWHFVVGELTTLPWNLESHYSGVAAVKRISYFQNIIMLCLQKMCNNFKSHISTYI